jgi:DNA-binding response OmpR family regulator
MPERILVVDKNLDSLKLVGLMLQRQGYQVSAAPDGIQALGLVETERPDLILMDIMVPDMDGYELCRRLKSDPRLAKIPLIIFTAKSGADDKVAGFEAGADDYLTKPTHPSELASRIKAMQKDPLPIPTRPALWWHLWGSGAAQGPRLWRSI